MKFLSINWQRSKNISKFLLLLIMIIAAYLRFESIWKLNSFTYDQARDALYIKRIIIDHKLRLIGTQTSIPGVYTPPFYYYLMAPVLFLFKLNPAGIDFATLVLNIFAVFFLFLCLENLTGNKAIGLIVSCLYAFNPRIASQSVFSWNPNTMPFFTLLGIWALLRIFDQPQKITNYLILFFALGININLHYSGVALLAAVLFAVLTGIKKMPIKSIFAGIGIFILLISPLLLFDIRHQFIISNNIVKYLKIGAGGAIPPPPLWLGIWQKLSFLLALPFLPLKLPETILILLFLGSLFYIFKNKRPKLRLVYLILLISVVVASLYSGGFFSFYLTPFYPLPFLILGGALSVVFSKKIFFFLLAGLLLLIVATGIKDDWKSNQRPNQNNFQRLMNISQSLSNKIDHQENFNLASLYSSPDRYDRNAVDYRYFLEAFYNKTTRGWDPLDYQEATDLYFISQVRDYNPLSSNIWEIQTFKPNKIVEQWEIEDVVIYHLIK